MRTYLFDLPPPDMVLEVVDLATSNDPLEISLQRRGWDLCRVKELQESISRKLTIDMFGLIEDLSTSELELQCDIDTFLKRRAK